LCRDVSVTGISNEMDSSQDFMASDAESESNDIGDNSSISSE
jgi:hypothetical protein